MTMWGPNITAAAQIKRLDSLTLNELGRLLHGSDTCTETKAEIVKRLRAANRSRFKVQSSTVQGS